MILLRFLSLVLAVWMILSGVLLRLRHHATDVSCQPICWYDFHLGTPIQKVDEFLLEQGLVAEKTKGRYLWTSDDNAEMSLIIANDQILRLEASWINPEMRPAWWKVLLYLGAPDGLRIESEVVANVRRMNVTMVYMEQDTITIIAIRRVSNDPATFGEFRIDGEDSVLRISRYRSSTPFMLQTVGRWRGFRWYPVIRTCC